MSLPGNLTWYVWFGSANKVSSIKAICLVAGSSYLCEVCDDEYFPPTWLYIKIFAKVINPFSFLNELKYIIF